MRPRSLNESVSSRKPFGKLLKQKKTGGEHWGWGREEVSQVQIAKEIGRDQSVVSRNVTAAIEAGYLKNLNLVRGERRL